MALNCYIVKIKGETQGDIKGSVTQKGREGWIECFAFDHKVHSPRDAASGLPTGKRVHSPLRIIKAIDKSTPLLMNVLVNNENIPELELRFFAPSTAGAETNFYTIRLTNANISEIKPYMLLNRNPDYMKYPEMEEVSFTYQKIEWTFVKGGITAMDDWEAPVA
jgi:type VI secretion system secreted protein Hcp